MHVLSVKTDRRTQLVDVTQDVQRLVASAKITTGLCYLYVPHTTAGIMINEHADPDVAKDIASALDRLVPANGPYHHAEGNSDAHIKAVLTGTSQRVLIENGKLLLGRWQGIFFCEFDGPRERHLQIKIVGDSK